MMSLSVVSIIEKKQRGQALSQNEIAFCVEGFVAGKIPDYQMSALLMAVYFQGMNLEETVSLTRAMLESGERLDFADYPGLPLVDKHSTGGVGDKLSLIIAPVIASCGGYMPKISGRGLGHTGGTLDKIESIPGFNTSLSPRQMVEAVVSVGAALAGQSDKLVPADKMIYALRDVTATISSSPLIAASIISKKAAEGIATLVMDVKMGEGSIFQEWSRGEALAKTLISVGSEFGINTVCLLTDMSQPLGCAVGNWLEVKECIEVMETRAGHEDVRSLCAALSGAMLAECGLAASPIEGVRRAESALNEGKALAKFRRIVASQGGNAKFIDHPEEYPEARFIREVPAESEGYISRISARLTGELSKRLGAGRMRKEDSIDHTAGIVFLKKAGDYVKPGEVLAALHSNSDDKIRFVNSEIYEIFEFAESPPPASPLIHKVLTSDGEFSWDEYIAR